MLWLNRTQRSREAPIPGAKGPPIDWDLPLYRGWVASVLALWLVALMDWTIRDRIPLLAVCFYATPPFVLGALAFLAAFVKPARCMANPRLARRLTRSAFLLCAVSFLQGFYVDFRSGAAFAAVPDAKRLVYWNIARGKFASWQNLAKQTRLLDADIVAIAEATDDEVQSRDFWETHFAGYVVLPLGDGLVVLAKGSVVEVPCDVQVKDGTVRQFCLKVDNTPLDLILADLPSHPLVSRGPILNRLFHLMESHQDHPTLVVGDFNTPPTSVWFQTWRKDWRHAWEVSGHGYRPTWPLPMPVLALDHVWGNARLTFHSCVCGWSRASDHRAVIVDFTMNREGSPKTDRR